ncbi:MAG: DUF4252 domain-containing protein [Chlorobi bacterium]|nr:DUF4252 domain-containing protein [Chlorobiota bacterium]
MKRILFLWFSALAMMSNAQEFERIFARDDHVDMVLVTKDMFDLITEIDANNREELRDFFGKLEYLAIFNTDRPETAARLLAEGKKHIRARGMRMLTRIKENGKDAEFYYIPAPSKGYARELILMIRYPDGRASLMQVKGNINMRKISLLALQATMLESSLLRRAEAAAP